VAAGVGGGIEAVVRLPAMRLIDRRLFFTIVAAIVTSVVVLWLLVVLLLLVSGPF
jgi:hypothetical protein